MPFVAKFDLLKRPGTSALYLVQGDIEKKSQVILERWEALRRERDIYGNIELALRLYVGRLYEPLPDGWTEFLDAASGRPYYHHAASGKTQWRRPEISAQEAAELHRGREDAKTGLPYFHHASSGKTQWARPAVGDIVTT